MRRAIIRLALAAGMITGAATACSETLVDIDNTDLRTPEFPNLAVVEEGSANTALQPAIWPFGSDGGETAAFQPRSTRKAFFLSLLLPGLGEWYAGSKTRAVLFMGVDAFAWYTYLTNTTKGNDLEIEFEQFANKYWHYTDTANSAGDTLHYNYWGFLKSEYDMPGDVNPTDYERIAGIIEEAGGGAHSLPSTKTQQYYEMIGKYDHFVYGWEDIIDNNPALGANGVPTGNYGENTAAIQSPRRDEYMSIRGDSNDRLKSAQRGVYLMMVNRVLSAIDAGRMAYRHNQTLDSDLSMIRVRMAQRQVLDNQVPMLMVFKPF